MPDEGVQELQLRGKQLVFLAMSATVVAVVIFLCGVMVGRGVPTARQAAAPIGPDVVAPGDDGDTTPATTAEAAEPSNEARPTLEYPEIVSDQPPAEKPLKPSPQTRPFAETAVAGADTARRAAPAVAAAKATSVPAKPAPAAKVPAAAAAKTPAAAKAQATAAPAASAPQAGGFQVQVAAYQRQGDASTVREKLVKKGYPAFVSEASTAAGTWYRVRVGGYETRNEAQAVATRLKREEQLEPWVTR